MSYELGVISVNERISLPSVAVIPALDRGFLLGDSLFEVMVGVHGKILDLSGHLARLRESAAELQMALPWSDAELSFELENLASLVGVAKKLIRLVVTRGIGPGIKMPKEQTLNKIIYVLPAQVEAAATYEKGLALKRKVKPFTERGAAVKMSSNYQRTVLALENAEREGFQDILWTNSEGEITEASSANIFLIGRTGDLVEIATAPAASGILLGVTRARVISLLNRAGIPTTERVIFADELPAFDEAFLSSSVRGLVPVSRIDGHQLHSARPTAVFRQIERLFNAWVASEVGFPVRWSTGAKV